MWAIAVCWGWRTVCGEQDELLVWSSDYHISPVADLKYLFAALATVRVRVLDKSLSGHCAMMNTCTS
jgi:hypothetical protein